MTEAELRDAGQARGIYEDIVRRLRDPALLEYAGQGLFRVRISGAGRPFAVVFLTDGLPTVGSTDGREILAQERRAALSANMRETLTPPEFNVAEGGERT